MRSALRSARPMGLSGKIKQIFHSWKEGGTGEGGNMTEDHRRLFEVVNDEVKPLPVVIYGRPDSTDTRVVCERLQAFEIPFVEVNIDEDDTARRFVERVNHGEQRIPTIVFGKDALIIVEPSFRELDQALIRAGYEI